MDAAFVPNHNYNHLLTSPVQITSLFNQCTSLLALNCSCPNFFWNVLQVWMTGKDVYLQMTWSWPDKTMKYFVFILSCNEIQKVNLEITTFFFYLRFPYCPNFFWFGVVYYICHLLTLLCITYIIYDNIIKYFTENNINWKIFIILLLKPLNGLPISQLEVRFALSLSYTHTHTHSSSNTQHLF